MRKLKIAIIVPGRFHAFDLARSLCALGHDVVLFTNYPRWAIKKFNLSCQLRSFWLHGVLTRLFAKLPYSQLFEPLLHKFFGSWAAKLIKQENWDVIHIWSGIAEEILKINQRSYPLTILMRGSAHIVTQTQLLQDEKKRVGVKVEFPSRWMQEREKREYALTQKINVLSTFAYNSFVTEGISEAKLLLLPLGVDVKQFYPLRQIIDARCDRILSNKSLRVLFVGNLSFQKGIHDLREIILALIHLNQIQHFSFTLIGSITPIARKYLGPIKKYIEIISKRPQVELHTWYAEADLFIFPTIQDGFAVVLSQATTSGLPILSTANCGGPDLIQENIDGWIMPIRQPQQFVERLLWCQQHRQELVEMIRNVYDRANGRDWDEVARNFTMMCIKNHVSI